MLLFKNEAESKEEQLEILLVEKDVTEEDTSDDAEKEAEKATAPHKDTGKEQCEEVPDTELEARFGLLEAIVTSQSQIIPDFSGRINLDSNDTALNSDESEEDKRRNSFSCHKCRYYDKSANALLAHKKDTHTEVFLCQMCEFESSGKDQLNKHIEDHKAMNRQCELCGQDCMNTSSLQKHIISKHCMSSNGQVGELLKMHLELLNTMLTKQNTAEGILSNMAVKQTTIEQKLSNIDMRQSCLATEVKEALRPLEISSSQSTATGYQQPPTYAEMSHRVPPQWAPPVPQQLSLAPQQQPLAPQ